MGPNASIAATTSGARWSRIQEIDPASIGNVGGLDPSCRTEAKLFQRALTIPGRSRHGWKTMRSGAGVAQSGHHQRPIRGRDGADAGAALAAGRNRVWRDNFPRLAQAMIAQASINGGARGYSRSGGKRALLDGRPANSREPIWPSPREAASRSRLCRSGDTRRGRAVRGLALSAMAAADAARAVDAGQGCSPRRIPMDQDTVPARGGGDPDRRLRHRPAGCGGGAAKLFPDARITAIDISRASLRYAERRCAEAGVTGVTFQALDLHRVAEFGRRFDAVFCAAWRAAPPARSRRRLGRAHGCSQARRRHACDGLQQPGRMRVQGLRRHLTDLKGQAISDDLLRRRCAAGYARRSRTCRRGLCTISIRWPACTTCWRIRTRTCSTCRASSACWRRLISNSFDLEIPNNALRASYLAEHLDDPQQRDFEGWNRLDRSNPLLYAQMFDLRCRRP